mmetsp:Transcript_176772/g.566985  ORF Transcript_176772/g.566985 Transcript_176772/m.566985 type:complete len:240 (-) Transcript_176772:662-1381(-)
MAKSAASKVVAMEVPAQTMPRPSKLWGKSRPEASDIEMPALSAEATERAAAMRPKTCFVGNGFPSFDTPPPPAPKRTTTKPLRPAKQSEAMTALRACDIRSHCECNWHTNFVAVSSFAPPLESWQNASTSATPGILTGAGVVATFGFAASSRSTDTGMGVEISALKLLPARFPKNPWSGFAVGESSPPPPVPGISPYGARVGCCSGGGGVGGGRVVAACIGGSSAVTVPPSAGFARVSP